MGDSERSIFNILIYPKIQVPLLFVILLTAFLVFVVMGAFCYLQMRIIFASIDNPEKMQVISQLFWDYGTICAIAMVFGLVMISFWSLLLTHRLVGPIPRLKQQIESMLEKSTISLIKVRDYDYLQSFYAKVNKILLALSENCQRFEPPDPN